MDWTWYLFRFEGRINRCQIRLAGLIIICWMIFALTLLDGIGGAFGIGEPPSSTGVSIVTCRWRSSLPLVY